MRLNSLARLAPTSQHGVPPLDRNQRPARQAVGISDQFNQWAGFADRLCGARDLLRLTFAP
jgi:hypothetical protein